LTEAGSSSLGVLFCRAHGAPAARGAAKEWNRNADDQPADPQARGVKPGAKGAALQNCPQKRAVCPRLHHNPKKPNSALRKVAKYA